MAEKYEPELLAKIAKDFYLKKLSIIDISNKYCLSRYLIAKALDEAEKLGIVQINIKETQRRNSELEKELITTFNLKQAYVLKDRPTKTQDAQGIITFAANKISNYPLKNKNIGLTWGTTVLDTVSHLAKKNRPDLNFVQLAGMSIVADSPFANYSLVEMAARKLNAKSFILPAPLYVLDDQLKKKLLKEPTFQEIEKKYQQLDLIITGIGTIKSIDASPVWKQLKAPLLTGIDQEQIAGMIFGRAYDIDGHIFTRVENKLTGISRQDILKTPIRLAIVPNRFKAKALLGALRTGLITHLVINEGMYHRLALEVK